MQTFDWYIPKGTSKLQYRQGTDIDSFIKSVARPDRDVVGTVTFKVTSKPRSLSFNGYYWASVVSECEACLKEDWGDVISTEMGVVIVNKMFAHQYLLSKCNKMVVTNQAGEPMEVTFGTGNGKQGNDSDLFYQYVERCKKFIFLQWNVTCRERGEQLEI